MANQTSPYCIVFPDSAPPGQEMLYTPTDGLFDTSEELVKTIEFFFKLDDNGESARGCPFGVSRSHGHPSGAAYTTLRIDVASSSLSFVYIGEMIGQRGTDPIDWPSGIGVRKFVFAGTPQFSNWYHGVLRVDRSADDLVAYLGVIDPEAGATFPGDYASAVLAPNKITTDVLAWLGPARPADTDGRMHYAIGGRLAVSAQPPYYAPYTHTAYVMDGMVSEIRFWNTERSDAEIDDYNMDFPASGGLPLSGLVHYWALNEATGETTIQDQPDTAINSRAHSFDASGTGCVIGYDDHPFASGGGPGQFDGTAATASSTYRVELSSAGSSGTNVEMPRPEWVIVYAWNMFKIRRRSQVSVGFNEFKVATSPSVALSASSFEVSLGFTVALSASEFHVADAATQALSASEFYISSDGAGETVSGGFELQIHSYRIRPNNEFKVTYGRDVALGASQFQVTGQAETSMFQALSASEFNVTSDGAGVSIGSSDYYVVSESEDSLSASEFEIAHTYTTAVSASEFSVIVEPTLSIIGAFTVTGESQTFARTLGGQFWIRSDGADIDRLKVRVATNWRRSRS